jgi:hypothetical protein
MSMTARGGTNDGPDTPPLRPDLDRLRVLAIGAALHSKGPRTFTVTVVPHGIEIRATDRALVRLLSGFFLISWDDFREIPEEALKKRLLQLDAELDREIARAR